MLSFLYTTLAIATSLDFYGIIHIKHHQKVNENMTWLSQSQSLSVNRPLNSWVSFLFDYIVQWFACQRPEILKYTHVVNNKFIKLQVNKQNMLFFHRITGTSSCPHIRILNVSHNMLHGLEGLERTPDLTELNASANQIETINLLPILSNLTVLHLRDNQVSR